MDSLSDRKHGIDEMKKGQYHHESVRLHHKLQDVLCLKATSRKRSRPSAELQTVVFRSDVFMRVLRAVLCREPVQ